MIGIQQPKPPDGYEWLYIPTNSKCDDCDVVPGDNNCQVAKCDQSYHGAYRLTHDIPWHHAAVLKDRRKYDRG